MSYDKDNVYLDISHSELLSTSVVLHKFLKYRGINERDIEHRRVVFHMIEWVDGLITMSEEQAEESSDDIKKEMETKFNDILKRSMISETNS